MDGAIGWRGGKDGELQGGEGLAGVAIGFFGEMLERIVVSDDLEAAEAAFGFGQCVAEEFYDVFSRKRFELKDL